MSGRRKARPIFFVCTALSERGDLLSKMINAPILSDARQLFKNEFGIEPKEIFGPFYKKQTQILETTRTLKFAQQDAKKTAIYHDWYVDVFFLIDPIDHAYLIFQRRVDDKKVAPPKGTITVPITDLRILSDDNK